MRSVTAEDVGAAWAAGDCSPPAALCRRDWYSLVKEKSELRDHFNPGETLAVASTTCPVNEIFEE